MSVKKFIKICRLVINPLQIIYKNKNAKNSTFWSDLTYNAKKRNLEVKITKNEALELLEEQGFRCKMTGLHINLLSKKRNKMRKTASVDRIDSKKGYEKSNIQWVHKDINQSRKHLDLKYYYLLCELVCNFNRSY